MQVQSYWRYPFGVGHDVAAFSSCKCYRDDSWGAKKKGVDVVNSGGVRRMCLAPIVGHSGQPLLLVSLCHLKTASSARQQN